MRNAPLPLRAVAATRAAAGAQVSVRAQHRAAIPEGVAAGRGRAPGRRAVVRAETGRSGRVRRQCP
eukprot:5189470-Lingulodinium_polyedra.AAC.1